MGDYTTTKNAIGKAFPDGAGDSSWIASEPLVTPAQIRAKHLFGLPLVSGMKDPYTGKAAQMTDQIIAEHIDQACSTVEFETGLTIFPTQIEEKQPWDRCDYDSYAYFKLKKRPIASIEKITVNLANNGDLYTVPLEWVEMGNARWGQVNIIPIALAMTSANGVALPTTAGGALLLSVFQNKSQWMAGFWKFTYTAGFPNGEVPKALNNLIGAVASIEILSQLAVTYAKSSASSLGIDGMNQSVSTPGPEIFNQRITDLDKKRQMLVQKLKAYYAVGKYQVGNV